MSRQPQATVGIAELKAHLSAYLRRVRRGEQIVVTDRERPVARLVPAEGEGPLRIIPPTRRWQDIELPAPPLDPPVDALELLLEDRERDRGDRYRGQ